MSNASSIQAEIILGSISPDFIPIYTIRLRYPRIIHAELMTHRVFSRNARSSRAVPVAKMIQEVEEQPFIPWHWGKNQRGMQADEECDEIVSLDNGIYDFNREDAWLWARNKAVEAAKGFNEAGYHKQLVNRILEPFTWIDVLVTATDWSNFLWLRDHEAAEPHIRDLALAIDKAINSYQLETLSPYQWHLPYVTDAEHHQHSFRTLLKISSARCARISYSPFDAKEPDAIKDIQLYNKLISDDRLHASPMEHQAVPDILVPVQAEILHSGSTPPESVSPLNQWIYQKFHGNFDGWIQHRKLLEGERHGRQALNNFLRETPPITL